MGAIEDGDALHARVRTFVDDVDAAPRSDAFERLARDLARFQARYVDGYARLVHARGVDLDRDPIARLPAVPSDAFRLARVATFPTSLDAAVFRTSGTTGAFAGRGAHAMRDEGLRTYRDAALGWARASLFERLTKPRIVAIAPRADEASDSSLSRMMHWFVESIGDVGSSFAAVEDPTATLESAASAGTPVVVLATAFAWVHLVDRLGERTIALPDGSRAMQTGGFKGRSREISAAELRAAIARALSIAPRDVVGEYGMTELSSQLYAWGRDDAWIYRAPPWVRVWACDPTSLEARPPGTRGIARIEDLANVESAWAIQTADEVIVHDDGGVELLGRSPGAPPRGCSLAIEELLAR